MKRISPCRTPAGHQASPIGKLFQAAGDSAAIRKWSLFLLLIAALMSVTNGLSTAAQENPRAVAPDSSALRYEFTPEPHSALKKPLLVAHRGASGYAPEHTLAAYELAIQQGADFVEQDLQITKDGVLICLHDPDLSRTTNVKEVFPDRATMRDVTGQGTAKQGWYAADFTLAEIKKLDAGSWFYKLNGFADTNKFSPASQALAKFKPPASVPTLQETIKFVNNRAGLYIELKDYEYYKALGFEMAKMLADVLKANGYSSAAKSKRIFIQSFSKEALLKMKELAPQYPRVQLLPMEDPKRKDTAKITAELALEYAVYAQGVGPAKQMITSANDVRIFHAAGLVIHPYTFRGQTTAVLRKPLEEKLADGSTVRQNILADMQRYLEFGIDGGFTDYPDLWKASVQSMKR
jgi:glycerophosphoryl diester phosphodiesterase